ncbi:NUT family member 2F-like [Pteropus vampyrus]|uniref:NUT family member 2F-like n=1 Tax=Pteropus vampyrus TaxID=132908 RepID=A0A6P3S679_PTEVA|nr:NUT family member 2F-like [Pteropus vampyrus]
MASKGACAVLGPAVTVNPGASMSPFMALPFPPPMPGPAYRPPWEQHLPPLMAPSFLPGHPLVLPAFPGMPLVARDAGHGSSGTGACNIIVQVKSEVGRAEPAQTQTLVLTQAPLNWSAPGTLHGGAACPAPLFLAASAVEPVMPTPAVGGTQAVEGGWPLGLPPEAPPPAAQLAPGVPPVNAGPWPSGASREGGMATSQSKASPDDSCNPKSVYENFRRWQRFKVLARQHLPQSPDAEALSCFLIPVLRSLSRLKPTMTLEEGVWRAVQEWQRRSNFDRMIFYEMAEKFMEFEAEEEMQIQQWQWTQGVQGLAPPAPAKPDPWVPPAPAVGPQPGTAPSGAPHAPSSSRPASACTARKAIPGAQPARPKPHRRQRPRETKAPKEIPAEAVREYMDIMDGLVGPAHSASGEEDRKAPQQEEDGDYLDQGLLSYIDELCSQEDFVTKVEAIIHPRFLEQLLSSETQLDPLALAEELEQEEALTPGQLVEKRFLALREEEGVQAPPSHGAPRLDSRSPESEAGRVAQSHDHGPQQGVSDKASPPEIDFKDPERPRPAEAHLSRPKAFAVSSGHRESPPLRAPQRRSAPHGHGRTSSGLGPRDASIPRETAPFRKTRGPADWSSEEEEELPSLSFLLDSQKSLLPWGFSLSPVSAPGLVFPGSRGSWGAPQSLSPQRIGLSRAAPPVAKSRKRPLGGGPAPAGKSPLSGADLGVSGRPALALGLVRSSQPQKRKCGPLLSGRRRKRYCSP